MLKFAAFCLLFFAAGHVAAQGFVRCDDGRMFWVIGQDGDHFAIPVDGDVSESNVDLINIDDKALAYIIIDAKSYYTADGKNSDKEILTRFIEGEIEALQLGDLKVKKGFKVRPDGEAILLWHHDWKPDSEVDMQVHATVVLDKSVVWLTSPKFVGVELKDIEEFLLKVISDVKSIEQGTDPCR